MPKIERKYLAHYLDAKFGIKGESEQTYTPAYDRLGKDLEEYNEELNPDVEVSKNIWCCTFCSHQMFLLTSTSGFSSSLYSSKSLPRRS